MSDILYVNSGGALTPVAEGDIPDAVNLGWVPASDKQVADYRLQQKYGGQKVATALESAGSALTFGLSTALERGAGIPAEDIAGREQANPGASMLGTVAGVGAGLAIPGSAPSLIAKLGKGAGTVVKLTGESAAARIAQRAAQLGLGSAVEGAAYGAGQVVHEGALGDPSLTAESAMATIGLSALMAGSLGAATGGLGAVAREYAPRELGAKVTSILADAEAHANFNATNAMPQQIKKVLRGKGAGATAIGLEARDLGILRNPISDSADAILDRATNVKAEQGRALEGVLSDVSRSPESPWTTWGEIDSEVRQPIAKALSGKGATAPIAEQFNAVMDRYGQAYGDRPLGLVDLWRLKQDVGDFIYKNGKVLDPWVKELNTPLKRVYDHIDGLIESGLKDAGGEQAQAIWLKANRAYEVASTFATLAESGVERSAANNPLHLTGAMGAAAGFATSGLGGATMVGAASEAARRRGAAATGYVARALRDFLTGDATEAVAGRTAEAIAAARQAGQAVEASNAPETVAALSALERNNATIAQRIEKGAKAVLKGASSESAAGSADYAANVELVQRMSDPQQLHDALTGIGDNLSTHAPQTAQAMQIAASRAAGVLASHVPQHPSQGPLADAWHTTATERFEFNNAFAVAQDPTVILRHAAAGTLTPNEVAVARAIAPALFAQMQAAVVNAMASGEPPPYRTRLMLAMLLGQDMDGTMSPQAIAAAQMPYLMAPPVKPKGALKPMKMSDRFSTDLDRSARRAAR